MERTRQTYLIRALAEAKQNSFAIDNAITE